MRTNIFLIITMGLSMQTFAAGNGGATTVGDGGFAVVCPKDVFTNTVELLDLFEARVMGKTAVTELGPQNLDIKDKVEIALQRTQTRLSLSNEETDYLRYVVGRFMRFPYDPWRNGKGDVWSYFLHGKWPTVKRPVYEEMKRRKCQLRTLVVRPNLSNRASAQAYDNICSGNFAGLKYCFLRDSRLYSQLSDDGEACLILHEVLRFLPPEKTFRTEPELRSAVHAICTNT